MGEGARGEEGREGEWRGQADLIEDMSDLSLVQHADICGFCYRILRPLFSV